MADGLEVALDQLREHAAHIAALKDRFGAVKAASAHIDQNNSAYGWLCQWMPPLMEERHRAQDELYAYVEENLSLVAQRLRQTVQSYDDTERIAADSIKGLATGAGRTQ
jgi:hypothetical protein